MILRRPLLAAWLLATNAAGQTLYVSDELVITVRTGPSTQNAIIANLRSGDPVEVLEADEEAGYLRVRTANGAEGWVLERYLSEEVAARDRLGATEAALAGAQDRVAELEQQVATLTEAAEAARQRLEDADAANTALNAELVDIRNTSADALTLRDSNANLRRSLSERDEQIEQLMIENGSLRDAAVREWFVVGAGVMLGGIVIGLVLPSMRRRRRTDW